MKERAQYLVLILSLLSFVAPMSYAETAPLEQPEAAFTQAELDQMLAPIALYPDSLLSQVLMAATYPLEVVQAARWSKANPGLRGEQAVRAVDDRNWDPSVKSLVAFPQLLALMDEKLDWTERLGDAFLAQQPQVMETVQGLRQRAYAAGNLKSSDEYRVEQQGSTIVVQSPPDVVYVPYYDPVVVYGGWWWPAYRPVFWAPWPGYYGRPGYVSGFRWSVGITVGAGFFFGAVDWGHRSVRVVDAHPFYYHHADRRPMPVTPVWAHNPDHRRGVPYRQASVREHYSHVNGSPDARRDYRGRVRSLPENRNDSPNKEQGDRADPRGGRDERMAPHGGGDSHPKGGTPPSRTYAPNTPSVRTQPGHVDTPRVVKTQSDQRDARPHALEDVGQGQEARRSIVRGRQSVQNKVADTKAGAAAKAPDHAAPAKDAGARDSGNAHSSPGAGTGAGGPGGPGPRDSGGGHGGR